jgi:phosphatidate cytidylyltransferase
MLKQGIITVIMLFVVFLVALFWLPQPYWAFLTAFIAAVAAWAWAEWTGCKRRECLFYAVGMFIVLMALGVLGHQMGKIGREIIIYVFLILYMLMSLFWLLIVPFWLWRRWILNRSGWGRCLLLFLGGVLILGTWIAFNAARGHRPFPGMLLWALGMVWVAEIAAGFAERKSGDRSSGMLLGVLLYGALAYCAASALGAEFPPEYPFMRFQVAEMLGNLHYVTLYALFLGALCFWGDRFFALLEQQAGVRARCRFLTGYGGALAAMLPGVAPMFAFFAFGFIMA